MASAFSTIFGDYSPLNAAPDWSSWASALSAPGAVDQSFYPGAEATYGRSLYAGGLYDPYATYQPQSGRNSDSFFAPLSVQLGHQLVGDALADYLNKTHPEYSTQFANAWGTGANQGVVGNPTDPKWANVNRWNADILKAVEQVQQSQGVYVPPNVVKAIMMIETQGVMPEGANYAGAGGLLQITPGSMGGPAYDYAKVNADPAYSIWAGVNDLALRWKEGKALFDQQNQPFGWANVASGYFSGHYVPNGSGDRYNTDYQYVQQFNDNFNALSAAGGAGVGGTQATPNTKQFNAIWGGFNAPVTQEFGHTDFADNSAYGQAAYDYTAAYSRDGAVIGHDAVDVGVTYGTKLYAPVAGEVTIAGGSGYYCDRDGNGCGPHVGELAITMSNGDVLILGHMSQIKLNVGDTVNPGDFVGFSGSENGAHVHVEYRKYWGPPGTVTSSGYEAVDPRQALAGNFTATYGSSAGSGPQVAVNPGGSWSDFMRAAATGALINSSSPPGVGGFHDWLYGAMPGHSSRIPDNIFGGNIYGWVTGSGDIQSNQPTQSTG